MKSIKSHGGLTHGRALQSLFDFNGSLVCTIHQYAHASMKSSLSANIFFVHVKRLTSKEKVHNKSVKNFKKPLYLIIHWTLSDEFVFLWCEEIH